MKTFSTSGTGNQQTLSEIESNKVPIYDSRADVEADLSNLEEGQIVGTKDTGSELSAPVDVVEEDNLHAVTSNAVNKALCYSTEEIDTGLTFGGKKVYKRDYYISSFESGSGLHNYSTGITNVDMMLKFNAIFKRSNGDVIEPPYSDVNGNYSILDFFNVNGTLGIITSVDETGASVIVHFKYTKTTD